MTVMPPSSPALDAPLVSFFLGESIVRDQIELIIRFQQSRFISARIASSFSLIGSGKVILMVLCLLLWLGDPRLGWKPSNAATHMLLACGIAKAFLKGPRPYFVDTRVKTLDPTHEESYGFPSGHTSGVVSIYGLIAAFYCDKESFISFGWIGYASICAFVALSRVYTGAHFVTDVVAGFVLGAVLLWNELRLCNGDGSHSHIQEAVYLFSISLISFLAISFAASGMGKGMIHFKLNQEGICGVGFAFGLGVCHLCEQFIFQTQTPSLYRPLSWFGCLLGVLGIVLIESTLKIALGGRRETGIYGTLFIASFYSLIMIWALWLVPLLFSQTEETAQSI